MKNKDQLYQILLSAKVILDGSLLSAAWLHRSSLMIAAGLILLTDLFLLVLFIRHTKQKSQAMKQFAMSGDLKLLREQYPLSSPEEELFFQALEKKLDPHVQIAASRKEAQLLALQNQINPHFLYNTLETIRSEALIEGIDSVASMTEALAIYFRYTISNLDTLVRMEDELNNVNSYCVIQHFRFGEKIVIHTEYDGDEADILSLYVPKLILQPVVENAIYHGLEEKLGPGEVKMSFARTEKRLLVMISDNGIGMDQEELEKINAQLLHNTQPDQMTEHRTGGIALINVNNRIKLLFGDEFGMHLGSVKGVGTDVHISLPVIVEPQAEGGT